MIQTISTPVGSLSQAALAASAGETSPNSFMAMFIQALAGSEATEGAMANPLLSALLGREGLDATEVEEVVSTGADGEVSATGEDSSLLAMLGLSMPAMIDVGKSALPAASKAAADDAGLAVDGKYGRPGGKKLPNPLAVIAGQQKSIQLLTQQELGDAVTAKAVQVLPVAGEGHASDASLLAVASALEKSSAPNSAPSSAAPSVSGQEAALMAARSQAAVGSPEKVVIGMQSGFGTTAWHQELGDKLVFMAGRQGQMAELILNPPSLGAVEVRLNMNGSEASAQFFSANSNVRDAIEAALPKLREMMQGAGIELGNASVSDQSFDQRDQAEQGKSGSQSRISLENASGPLVTVATARISTTALLDYFA